MANNEAYIGSLEQLINDLHHELGMTVYSVEDISAASDINRTADRLWDEFCAVQAAYYTEQQ
jgi:hypothetical protein